MKNEQWLFHFEKQKSSGMTVKSYVKAIGIKSSSWYRKKKDLLDGQKELKPAHLIEPMIVDHSVSSINIRLKNNIEVHIKTSLYHESSAIARFIRELSL